MNIIELIFHELKRASLLFCLIPIIVLFLDEKVSPKHQLLLEDSQIFPGQFVSYNIRSCSMVSVQWDVTDEEGICPEGIRVSCQNQLWCLLLIQKRKVFAPSILRCLSWHFMEVKWIYTMWPNVFGGKTISSVCPC